jgi:hypothetical protein
MDWAVLELRLRTLEQFLNKIEKSPGPKDKLTIGLEASRISDKIIHATEPRAFSETEYDTIVTNLEHISLACFMDNMEWARKSIENIRSLNSNE